MTAATPRVRFAPSPTGYLHVGGARTALYNWLYARKHGGKMLLRIEDTDRARSTDESTRAIFDGLAWLGLSYDETVVFQGANIEQHRADADRMLGSGSVYRCFCTPAELELRRKEAADLNSAFKYDRRCDRLPAVEVERRVAAGEAHVLRFRVPDGEISWDDLVHERITFPSKDIEDFVILRSDRTPIYNMAVVSDDIAMGITLVMRGDDHISNTPKQILLYEALGATIPRFAHLPMIHGTDGKKLSKRTGAAAVADWQHQGILPQAMVNFLALLGWSPGGEFEEVMSLEDLVAQFDEKGLLRKASVFDPKKLEWMNGQHLSRLPLETLIPLAAEAIVAAGLTTADDLTTRADWFRSLLELLRVRARLVDDIVRQAEPYLKESIHYDPEAVAKQWKDPAATIPVLVAAREALATLEPWEAPAMEEKLRQVAESIGVGGGKFFQPLRVALTGLAASPGIFDVLLILGRERALARIVDAERALAAMLPTG